MIKIAIADDHIILRKSLAIMIGMIDGFEVVFEADNGFMLTEKLKTVPRPDIILLDITMPVMDGFETSKWLKKYYPGIKIIALTMMGNEPVLYHMVKNGVRGYLLKDCDLEELEKAIRDVHHNGYYFNEYFTEKMTSGKVPDNKIILNGQELAFLKWSCTDLTHKEIAVKMDVSPRTVDGYRDALFKKLDVSSRIGIVIYAIRNCFIQL